MPNWCEDKLTIAGASGVLACLDAIRGEPNENGPRPIDFQRIVPMPSILDEVISGTLPDMGRVLLGDDALGQEMLSHAWVQKEGITDLEHLRKRIRHYFPRAEAAGQRALDAHRATGYYDWCEWRLRNWGTKWNATCVDTADGATDALAELRFDTPWSPPIPIVVELSKQFPELTFALEYWEGGCGFQGVFRAKAGEVLQDDCYEYDGTRGG